MKKLIFFIVILHVLVVNNSNAINYQTTSSQYNFSITVKFASINKGDGYYILYSNFILFENDPQVGDDINENYPHIKSMIKALSPGTISFSLKVPGPGYISIFKSDGNVLLSEYLIEPWDHVFLDIAGNKRIAKDEGPFLNYWADLEKFDYNFNGKGALKYNLRFETDRGFTGTGVIEPYTDLSKNDSVIRKRLNRILLNRKGLSNLAFQTLSKDVMASYQIPFLHLLSNNAEHADLFKICGKKFISYLNATNNTVGNYQAANLSKGFAFLMLTRALLYCQLANNGKYDFNATYYYVKNKYKRYPSLRHKMIAQFFLNYQQQLNSDGLISDAVRTVKSSQVKTILDKINNNTKVGEKPFDFALPDVNNTVVSLEKFKGKVVFIDFWFTGCGACKQYYQEVLSSIEKEFANNKELIFVTICVDKNRETWLKSVTNGIYTSDSVVNLYTDGQGANHAVIKHYQVITYPHPMIIAKNGMILKNNGNKLRTKDGLEKLLKSALAFDCRSCIATK